MPTNVKSMWVDSGVFRFFFYLFVHHTRKILGSSTTLRPANYASTGKKKLRFYTKVNPILSKLIKILIKQPNPNWPVRKLQPDKARFTQPDFGYLVPFSGFPDFAYFHITRVFNFENRKLSTRGRLHLKNCLFPPAKWQRETVTPFHFPFPHKKKNHKENPIRQRKVFFLFLGPKSPRKR